MYCPLYPFGSITKDSNDDRYYSYNNIDPNTCKINYNNQGLGSQVYSIYGPKATNISNGDPPVGCNFNLVENNPNLVNPMLLKTQPECTNMTNIQKNIDTIKNNSNYIALSNPHNNSIECGNYDCKIYVNLGLNPVNIKCPKGPYSCTVIWFVMYMCYIFIIFNLFSVWIHSHVPMLL